MLMILAVSLLTTVPAIGHTDTTLAVRRGTRLQISNFSGSVNVSTWDRDAIRIAADRSGRTRVELSEDEEAYHVGTTNPRGVPGSVDFDITAPAWMALEIEGPMTDVNIQGTHGNVKVETVKGEISVDGGNGALELSSVQGDVSVARANGRVKLSSINENVTATQINGQIEAETVNGDIVLDGVQLDALHASSVGGDLWFSGTLKPSGRYQLESHSGDIQVVTPDSPDANVSVSTFSGEFSSDFDLMLSGTRKRERMQFTLGHGGAQIELQSFSGDIQLLKESQVNAIRSELKSQGGERAPRAPRVPRTPKPPKTPKSPKSEQNDSDN